MTKNEFEYLKQQLKMNKHPAVSANIDRLNQKLEQNEGTYWKWKDTYSKKLVTNTKDYSITDDGYISFNDLYLYIDISYNNTFTITKIDAGQAPYCLWDYEYVDIVYETKGVDELL